MNILMKGSIKVCCNVQPLGVTDNASFIVDIDAVSFKDLKTDDVGRWISVFLTLERFEFAKQTL